MAPSSIVRTCASFSTSAGTAAVMVEPSGINREVKSLLNQATLADVFARSSLRALSVDGSQQLTACCGIPLTSATTSICHSSTTRARSTKTRLRHRVPFAFSAKAALFAGASDETGRARISPKHYGSGNQYLSLQVSIRCFAFVYVLFRRVTTTPPWAAVARGYSEEFFKIGSSSEALPRPGPRK